MINNATIQCKGLQGVQKRPEAWIICDICSLCVAVILVSLVEYSKHDQYECFCYLLSKYKMI